MKEFKITEEQIKENKDLTLKEYFKEVFEIKLEVGKWYKYNKWLINYKGIYGNDILLGNYAFNSGGIYESYLDCNALFGSTPEKWELATEEEVFNALKKEAEKRGFVKGAKVKDNGLHISCMQNEILKDNSFRFYLHKNEMWMTVGKNNYNCLIFNNGKWAEIISQPDEVIELNGVKYKRID